MNKKIKKLCVIAQGYPTDKQPWFAFVDQLLCAMSECGVECTVIAPQSLTKGLLHTNCKRPTYWERSHKGSVIKVYQPRTLSFSNFKIKGVSITDINFERAVIKCYKKINQKFDVIYGHFWICGLIAAKIGKMNDTPAFVACGESTIKYDALARTEKHKHDLNGVICVSKKCMDESVSLGLCEEGQTVIFPNAIDETVFYKRDKAQCRQALGISNDVFVVAFVGSFNNRKGSLRVSAALDRIPGVHSIFIGVGSDTPTCENRIYTGSLPHDKIPEYLSAADAFVLPTLHEGCCNAIVEAMACGLPIISSALPFNDDILNERNSIRIDPNSIDEIESAIRSLMEDAQLREQMAAAALGTVSSLTIVKRAQNILSYMESKG